MRSAPSSHGRRLCYAWCRQTAGADDRRRTQSARQVNQGSAVLRAYRLRPPERKIQCCRAEKSSPTLQLDRIKHRYSRLTLARSQRPIGVTGRKQKCLSVGDEAHEPVVAFLVAESRTGFLLAAVPRLQSSGNGSRIEKVLEVVACIQCLHAIVALVGGPDYCGLAGFGFHLLVVIGLAQAPESGYRDAHMSARHDIGSGMKAVLSVLWRLGGCGLGRGLD